MIKKVDQVLAALGNVKAMERLHVDTFTESEINNVDGEKIGESTDGQLYILLHELNGFVILEATILSKIKIKTFKGGTLTFTGIKDNFKLVSDTQEVDSEYSNIVNRYFTKLSFNITKKEINQLKNGDFKNIQFDFKKKSLNFNKV